MCDLCDWRVWAYRKYTETQPDLQNDKGKATDGKDPGADIAELTKRTAGVQP